MTAKITVTIDWDATEITVSNADWAETSKVHDVVGMLDDAHRRAVEAMLAGMDGEQKR